MNTILSHFRENKRLHVAILAALLLILGFSANQIVAAQIKVATPPPNSDSASIQMLENNLANKNLDDETRKSLETKLQVYYFNATQKANALSRATSIPNRSMTKPQIPTSAANKRMVGIINRPAVPFPSSAYLIENAWQEKINDKYILIFAGVVTDDPQQGILIIQSDNTMQSEFIFTPQKMGSIKISDVKGLQLVLQTKNQDTFYFDVPGRKFIASLGEVVPTITTEGQKKLIATPVQPTPNPYP